MAANNEGKWLHEANKASVSEQEWPVIMLFIVFLQYQVTVGMFTAPALLRGLQEL